MFTRNADSAAQFSVMIKEAERAYKIMLDKIDQNTAAPAQRTEQEPLSPRGFSDDSACGMQGSLYDHQMNLH